MSKVKQHSAGIWAAAAREIVDQARNPGRGEGGRAMNELCGKRTISSEICELSSQHNGPCGASGKSAERPSSVSGPLSEESGQVARPKTARGPTETATPGQVERPPAEWAVNAADRYLSQYDDGAGDYWGRHRILARIIEAEAPPDLREKLATADAYFPKAALEAEEKLRECEEALEAAYSRLSDYSYSPKTTAVLDQIQAALKAAR